MLNDPALEAFRDEVRAFLAEALPDDLRRAASRATSVFHDPAVSLPCGWTPQRLPVGAQLVAAPYEDARLLSIAAALELELARG